MQLYKTPVHGMCELSAVGYNSTQNAFDAAMKSPNLKGCNIVVASLTVDQTEGAKLLLKNGFSQIGVAKRNPNTGHMILLFTKTMDK